MRAAGRITASKPHAAIDELLEAFSPQDSEDDATVLAIRVTER